MQKMVSALCLLLPLLGGSSCPAAPSTEPKRLRVLTSFLPVYCFAANVAGDRALVENLLPANVGPHDYQFSRRDLEKVSRADLILINGLGLETWLDKLLRNAPGSRAVVAVNDGLTNAWITGRPGHQDMHADSAGAPNPHLWLDPRLAMSAVTNVLNAFRKADPANAAVYEANASAYLARLKKLDADFVAGLAPAGNAPLVTYHDAFAYLARRYELRIAGVIEEVPDVEPSPRHLADLRRIILEQKVKVVFTESQEGASRMVQRFARDLGVPIATLDTLETGPLTPAAYEEGMRRNLRILETHLTKKTAAAEIRNPKSEARKKSETRNPNGAISSAENPLAPLSLNRSGDGASPPPAFVESETATSRRRPGPQTQCARSSPSDFGIRISFGFRPSDFGFPAARIVLPARLSTCPYAPASRA